MKRLFTALFLIFLCGCAARSQSVSVVFKPKTENLSTVDSLAASKPCNGITEITNTSDSLSVLHGLSASGIISEKLSASDSIASPRSISASVVESSSVSDRTNLASAFEASPSEMVAVTDSVGTGRILTAALSESMQTTDSFGLDFVVVFPLACVLSISGNIVACIIQ